MLILLLIGMLTMAFIFDVKPVQAWTGTVYIRADGTIDPPDAPITTLDNMTYTLNDNIRSYHDGIVVERDNMIIDGIGCTVQGGGDYPFKGIILEGRSNVTIKNLTVWIFFEGIRLHNSSNNTISGNNIVNNWDGIRFDFSSNNVIRGNNIRANKLDGIFIFSSLNNTISGNSIENNKFDGICLDSSSNNVICGNNITSNYLDGIDLTYSLNNTICGNNITDNCYGINLIHYSSNNVIYHNNFINNTKQAYIETGGYPNTWDDGYPFGGNYWSDYTGTDCYSGPYQNETGHDSIGDTPYVIDANNTDRYPLIYPYCFVPCPDVNGDRKVDILDAVKAAVAFGSTPGHRRWDYNVDQNKDSTINILDLIIIAKNFGKTYP